MRTTREPCLTVATLPPLSMESSTLNLLARVTEVGSLLGGERAKRIIRVTTSPDAEATDAGALVCMSGLRKND